MTAPTPMSDERLAELEGLSEAATPAPWVIGDWWNAAGVMPEMFGTGRCALCERLGEPVWTGRRDINGAMMLAHVHVQTEPIGDGHTIHHYGGDGHPVAVADNYDYDAGGIVSPADAELIVAARNALDELVAEVRRQRRGGKTLGEITDKQLTDIVDLTESHDIIGEDGDGDWMLVWERLHQIRADRDASNARVAELEEQVKLLSGANRQLGDKAERLERENDRLAATREHPHSAKLAARILRAEDRVEELEQELSQLQAASRPVLDDRDRLQDRVLAVQELANDALQYDGTRPRESSGAPILHQPHDALCWRYHPSCLADRIRRALDGEATDA